MKRLRIGIVSLIAIVFVLWLLNPSSARFKDFSAGVDERYDSEYDMADKINKIKTVRKKVKDYLIFSVYEKGEMDEYGKYIPKERYRGILLNFYKI
jgi:hypothetical protein